MTYKKTTIAQVPKRTRVRIPRFEKTKEWKLMKVDLDKGLERGGALAVYFTEADMLKYSITNRRTVARYVKNYITAHKLPYTVKSFQSPTGFNVLVYGPRQ